MSEWYTISAGHGHLAIEVDLNTCLETLPCQHYVRGPNGEVKRMSRLDIAELFAERGQLIPSHFHTDEHDSYADFKSLVKAVKSAPKWSILPEGNGHEQIEVGTACRKSKPCVHYVRYNDNTNGSMHGDEIVHLYVEQGLPIPDHFAKYLKSDNESDDNPDSS